VRNTLQRLKASFPGVDYKITYDTTVFVKESINGWCTLIEAFVPS
jgi:multidrug efflux pump subunit AcrB